LDYLSNFTPRPPAEAKNSHLVDRYLDVLKPLGIENPARRPYLKTSASADQAIEALLKKEKADTGELLVGLFPGSGHAGRRWPIEKFAELADYLTRNNRVRVIVFVGPEERELIPTMRPLFQPTTLFFDKLTIPQLASAQARLTLFVSNDTGPMHVAAAVGTSVIVLMDRPTPHVFVPIGDQHRLIFSRAVGEISVAEVYKVAHEVLASNRTDQLFSFSEQR